jgi:hypothetical protein
VAGAAAVAASAAGSNVVRECPSIDENGTLGLIEASSLSYPAGTTTPACKGDAWDTQTEAAGAAIATRDLVAGQSILLKSEDNIPAVDPASEAVTA